MVHASIAEALPAAILCVFADNWRARGADVKNAEDQMASRRESWMLGRYRSRLEVPASYPRFVIIV